MGLKTTYYLRTLAASQIEKSTLDAAKYGFTQKREYAARRAEASRAAKPVSNLRGRRGGQGAPRLPVQRPIRSSVGSKTRTANGLPIEDPDCEACQ